MQILLKQVTIIDRTSRYHLQKKDILFTNGILTHIENEIITIADTLIDQPNTYLSQGFIDSYCNLNSPGYEHNETLQSGAKAAQQGGYTALMLLPNTLPLTDNATAIQYLIQQANNLPVSLYPMGAITTYCEGKQLTQMIEMQQQGAVAFTDGTHPIQQAGILFKAMQYVQAFNGVIIQCPTDASLAAQGQMHEGVLSTQLGLSGLPAIAEEAMLQRDIALCAETTSKLHVTGISTAVSINIIRTAKAAGIPITCSVSPYHLLLTQAEVDNYNTNAKVNPPLRTQADVTALQQALVGDIIDCVASHHLPQHTDVKQCEFANAAFGMSTIQHTFNAVATVPNITALQIVNLLQHNVAKAFNLTTQPIAIGNKCNHVIFRLDAHTTVTEASMASKSNHSAFLDKQLNGKIIATLHNQHTYINQL